MAKTDKILLVLGTLADVYPQAGTRLKFQNPFQLLVAVMLSARTTDEQVNRVTRGLFAEVKSPKDLASMEVGILEDMIKGCGLYRQKARNLIALARILMEEFGGEVPTDFDQLLRLPGVGRKTANVVVSVGFAKPGLGVDTHVLKVSRRLGWHNARDPRVAEAELKRIIPESWWARAHHLFISHGRAVCRARKPDCDRCTIRLYCQYGVSGQSDKAEDRLQSESSA
ncbi:MAG: endonuclease III [Syntrophothermus sp.]|uniref:endonuclease III n=1 Tax=Syntrophothermus sp. TaxID=2736299 RepID=UPI00257BA96E|nr:endonuclease III [Syntrophothermus sp.]NSW82275.1 endonuclease III [Syntrophothermus sp.]